MTHLVLAVDLVSGGLVAAGLWAALRTVFQAPLFARPNHRGIDVPVAAGIITAVAAAMVAAVGGLLPGDVFDVATLLLLVAFGYGGLGFFDDVAAAGADRGFRGHLGAMAGGRLTTGGLKLVGGGALGLVVGAAVDPGRPGLIVLDGALVALAANLGNLFDRAPGRCTKVAVVAFIALWASNPELSLGGVAVVVGAAVGLLAFDLREQLMLGDAGANVVGAALGTGVVLTTGVPVRVAVVGVLVVLNLASEVVSFSRLIGRVPPLRALDLLGRRPAPATPPSRGEGGRAG